MFLTKKTWILGLFMLLLGLMNVIPSGGGDVAELPALPMVAPAAVSRIEIARATKEKVILNRDEDGIWMMTAPFEAPADEPGLNRLLSLFEDGVTMDARLDDGNLETYGLDFQNGVVVELFTGAGVPMVSFVVGMDTRGGSSFVRLKDEEVVYRARVGGRYQYDRDGEDWRERMVVSEDPADVVEVAIQQGDEGWRFQSVDPTMTDGGPGVGWSLVEEPDFDLDDRTVDALVKQLTTLRAGRILPDDYDGGFDEPAATARLTFSDGEQLTLAVGARSTERASYVRRDDRAFVYQVAGVVGVRLLQGLETYRNLNVLSFERGDLLSVRFKDEGVPLTVSQTAPGVFGVTDPPNVDLDPRMLLAAVATLADLRADGTVDVPSEEAGFDVPRATLTLRFEGGGETVLEIGDPLQDPRGRTMYFARVLGGDRIYALRDATWANVRKGFGRAG